MSKKEGLIEVGKVPKGFEWTDELWAAYREALTMASDEFFAAAACFFKPGGEFAAAIPPDFHWTDERQMAFNEILAREVAKFVADESAKH